MSMVAFLASTVDSRVAGVAAKAALEAIQGGPPKKAEPEQKKQAATEGVAGGDKMDVDNKPDEAAKTTKEGSVNADKEKEKEEKQKEDEADVWSVIESSEGQVVSAKEEKGKEKEEKEKGADEVKSLDDKLGAEDIKAASAAALAAAAMKAKALALVEEREIQKLVAVIIEAQLKKLEAKLEHFVQMEQMLEKEKLQVYYSLFLYSL